MLLLLQRSTIRDFRPDDAGALVRHANNRKVSINLRDTFPHPYTRADADAWIRTALSARPVSHFAIEVDGEAAGGIGLRLGADVFRRCAEIGFWLGEAHWNRGIVSEALRALTGQAFALFDLERIQAGVFDWNPASRRVFEKAGYAFEGCMHRAVVKEGRMLDLHIYAALRPPVPAG